MQAETRAAGQKEAGGEGVESGAQPWTDSELHRHGYVASTTRQRGCSHADTRQQYQQQQNQQARIKSAFWKRWADLGLPTLKREQHEAADAEQSLVIEDFVDDKRLLELDALLVGKRFYDSDEHGIGNGLRVTDKIE